MCKHPKGHKFQKFDDTSLFCERCGERRVISYPTFVPDWTYRPPIWWPNTWTVPTWYPPYIVTSWSTTTTGWDDAEGGGSPALVTD